ncbi:MAG TPA: hypothetical protein EYM31_08070, partial [Acidobacteria bacterium]|nr:hypothetical protein [Acidobacteriota bacterium]
MSKSSNQPESGKSALSLEQKRMLYRDGYIVLKNAVSEEQANAALARISEAKKGEYIGREDVIVDLINASSITPILNEAMGEFDPPIACQVGVIPVTQPNDRFTNLGYRDKDLPYYGAGTHMDGSITIAAPQ